MMRAQWKQRLEFAAQATLAELIVPQAQTTGSLEGELGRISAADRAALAQWGLPAIEGCLYPAIINAAGQRAEGPVFHLGSYDSPLPDGPEHLFVAETRTGEVAKVSRADGEYRVHANGSLRQFVELAWRFYHVDPVLHEMQHSGSDAVPFADAAEDDAVRGAAWAIAVQVDPALQERGEGCFWWAMTWWYL